MKKRETWLCELFMCTPSVRVLTVCRVAYRWLQFLRELGVWTTCVIGLDAPRALQSTINVSVSSESTKVWREWDLRMIRCYVYEDSALLMNVDTERRIHVISLDTFTWVYYASQPTTSKPPRETRCINIHVTRGFTVVQLHSLRTVLYLLEMYFQCLVSKQLIP